MRRHPHLLLLAALLLAGSSFGFYLNDEADQAVALYNLAHGSLRVNDVPPAAYGISENISDQRRWGDVPIASTPLNLLALPVAATVLALDWLAPISLWLSAVAIACAWLAFPARWREEWQRRHPWRVAGAILVALALATARFRVEGPTMAVHWPVVALQLTNALLFVAGAALLWRVLAPVVTEPPGRLVAWLAVLVGPWLYWGHGLKYHLPGAVVLLALVAALQAAPSGRRHFLVGLLAGLAAWVNVGIGAVAILALVVLELARLWPERRELAAVRRRWILLAGGGLAGLAPMFLENFLLFGNPLYSSYFALAGGGSTTAEGSGSAVLGLLVGMLYWHGWGDFAANLGSLFTTGQRVEGKPIGIFLVSPLLAGATLGIARRPWRRPGPEGQAFAFAALFLLLHALLFTNAGVRQGAGPDTRLWFHVLGLLGILAAHGLSPWLRQLEWRHLRTVAAAAGGVLLAGVLALVACGQAGVRLGPTPYDHVSRTYWGLAALAAATAALALAMPLRLGRGKRLAVAAGAALAIPAFWTLLALGLTPKSIPDGFGAEGGGMFLPGVEPLAETFQDAVFPPGPLPFVYDDQGNLVFHPDYGRCVGDHNPCPTEIREALRRPPLNQTTEPS